MACAYLQRFPLRNHLSERPDADDGRPRVVFREHAGRTRVLCASPEASRIGVHSAMAVPDARALVPDLVVVPEDPLADAERLQSLGEVLLEFGPRVFVLSPDALLVEVGGSAHLFGGEGPLLLSLGGVLERLGFPARTAVADGWVVARILAQHGPRNGLVVPSGQQETALAPLPLSVLLPGIDHHLDPGGPGGGDAEVFAEHFVTTMDLLGVRRVRELAALPGGAVADRFGAVGRVLHARARGLGEAPPLPSLRPVEEIREVLELAGACVGWEPLLFHVKRLIDRVAFRLQARGEAALRLHLELLYHPDGVREVDLSLGRGTRDPRALHRVLRECLARERTTGDATIEGGVTQVELRVVESERSEGAQRDLVFAAERRGEDLPDLVERLSAALGEGAVFSPVLVDTHRPEKAWDKGRFPRPSPPAPTPAPSRRVGVGTSPRSQGPRPLILFQVPERFERRLPVVGRAPIERLSGQWWDEDGGYDRSYRILTLSTGERLWVFRDRRGGQAYVAGVFD